MKLAIQEEDLSACVSCGLCLPHCPTYRVTGEESASPRGRIAAMRAVQWEARPLDDDFTRFMDLCVQCRACEVQHRGMGTMEQDCKNAIERPWR